MTYLHKWVPTTGFSEIVKPGDAGLARIGFEMLCLKAGETVTREADAKERALVILSGRAAVRGSGFSFDGIGGRTSVFSERATTVYLPAANDVTVHAETDLELAVCQATSDRHGKPQLIPPDAVKEVSIGKDNWQRKAYLLLDESVPAQYLFIGEAIVPPGNWSSFPPHRHDLDALPDEVDMEEIYFFRFNRPHGFGIQRIYTDDRSINEVLVVEENDTVLIPKGYHPVVNAPGYSMYYLWIMAGVNRKFISRPDPDHRWVAKG